MRRKASTDDLVSGAFGLLAFALAAGAIVGIVRPGPEGMGASVPTLAFSGLIAGVLGLFVSRTSGLGRQVAVLGCGIALIAVALFGGSIAFEALLETP